MNPEPKSREELVREADVARARLLRTVERLDRRGHEALDLRRQLRKHVSGIAAAAGLAVLTAGAAIALAVHRVAVAADRRRRARWHLARTVWLHPDRALRAQRGPFFGELLRSLAFTLATTALTFPARRGVRALVDRLMPERRALSVTRPVAAPAVPEPRQAP